jgi:hypothetical protein
VVPIPLSVRCVTCVDRYVLCCLPLLQYFCLSLSYYCLFCILSVYLSVPSVGLCIISRLSCAIGVCPLCFFCLCLPFKYLSCAYCVCPLCCFGLCPVGNVSRCSVLFVSRHGCCLFLPLHMLLMYVLCVTGLSSAFLCLSSEVSGNVHSVCLVPSLSVLGFVSYVLVSPVLCLSSVACACGPVNLVQQLLYVSYFSVQCATPAWSCLGWL